MTPSSTTKSDFTRLSTTIGPPESPAHASLFTSSLPVQNMKLPTGSPRSCYDNIAWVRRIRLVKAARSNTRLDRHVLNEPRELERVRVYMQYVQVQEFDAGASVLDRVAENMGCESLGGRVRQLENGEIVLNDLVIVAIGPTDWR